MFKPPFFAPGNGKSLQGRPRPPQPFSPHTMHKQSRLRGATFTESVCPCCAAGCGTHAYTKAGTIIDIEGDPDSPINEGTLCPKGANTFQLHSNPHRVKHAMYRAPYSDYRERVPLEWAMGRIAGRVKEARDEGYPQRDEDGRTSPARRLRPSRRGI